MKIQVGKTNNKQYRVRTGLAQLTDVAKEVFTNEYSARNVADELNNSTVMVTVNGATYQVVGVVVEEDVPQVDEIEEIKEV